jgi:Siphovirus Gp157
MSNETINRYYLHNITAKYDELLSLLESGDIPVEAIEDTLEALRLEGEDEIIEMCRIMLNINGACDVITNEIKRLSEKKILLEKKADKVKSFILYSMKALVSRREIDGELIILDEAAMPEEFIEKRVSSHVDKAAIRKMYKESKNKPDWCLIPKKESLVIKQ